MIIIWQLLKKNGIEQTEVKKPRQMVAKGAEAIPGEVGGTE